MDLKIDDVITDYIHGEALLIDEKATVEDAAKKMSSHQLGSIIVTRGGKPLGILTEWDMLGRVIALGRDPQRTRVDEVMSVPLITINPSTKTGEAIALMIKHGVRRLVVVDNDRLIGIVSQSYMIGDRRDASAPLPILELAKGVSCPYCASTFENKNELSKHIDRIHIGSGLLEGDHRRW
ncbi:MAG: CBS domain-containing protein [Nitrososphaerales archaeon]